MIQTKQQIWEQHLANWNASEKYLVTGAKNMDIFQMIMDQNPV